MDHSKHQEQLTNTLALFQLLNSSIMIGPDNLHISSPANAQDAPGQQ
jgi:hypothetical protein